MPPLAKTDLNSSTLIIITVIRSLAHSLAKHPNSKSKAATINRTQIQKTPLHSDDLLVLLNGLDAGQVVPPLPEEGFADELEPWGKGQLLVLEHVLELLLCHVFNVLALVGVCNMIDGGLDEENVIN